MPEPADPACLNCGRSDTYYRTAHSRPDGRRCVFVRVWRHTYLPEDVGDGDISYRTTEAEIVDCLPEPDGDVVEAALHALAEADVGQPSSTSWDPHVWYVNADGDWISDMATGERTEPSAHLYGFTDTESHAVFDRT